MEVKTIEIFGKQMFGGCAEEWLKLCKQQKKQWILKNTDQRNEFIIDEFINNPNITKNCKCTNCGKDKANEPNGIPKEITTTTKSVNNAVDSRKNSAKRSKKS